MKSFGLFLERDRAGGYSLGDVERIWGSGSAMAWLARFRPDVFIKGKGRWA